MDDEKDRKLGLNSDEVTLGRGRGRFWRDVDSTPLKGASAFGSPAFSSTRIQAGTPPTGQPTPSIGTAASDIENLITQLAHGIGQSIASQLQNSINNQSNDTAHTRSSNTNQSHPELNMTGVKLIMKTDAKEPPHFRGDGTDKHSIHEWEEIMDVYLRKRGIPVEEQAQEIMSRLMGKARDIVRVTLRSTPSLKPAENPKLVIDILKLHFSELTYSSMPLADFYNTFPLPGESSMDYWIRLSKAVDVAEECLKRQGRTIEDPSREITMMFVKHCPDQALSSVLKFKTAEKWTASEIQERLVEHQRETRVKLQGKTGRPTQVKHVDSHIQIPAAVVTGNSQGLSGDQNEVVAASPIQAESGCIQSLIGLLDRVLEQRVQSAEKQQTPLEQTSFPEKRCRVCQSAEHSTLIHCRQKNLCLGCFKPGHWKRDCRKWRPRNDTAQRADPNKGQGKEDLN